MIDSCIFCNFTTTRTAFSVRDPTYYLELRRSRFDHIFCNADFLFNFCYGLNCTIFLSCFHRTASNLITSITIDGNSYDGAKHSSINLTSESVSGLGISTSASYFGGLDGCAFFHNNFSGISVKTSRSGFSLEYSPFVEGSTGFMQAVNCEGAALMGSYLDRNQLYEKMNLLNSSVFPGRGLFALCHTSFKTTLKDFIIESKEQRNWIDTGEAIDNPTLALISCKILGYQPPASDRVDASGVLKVETAVPNRVKRNDWILCRNYSTQFTIDAWSRVFLILLSLIVMLAPLF